MLLEESNLNVKHEQIAEILHDSNNTRTPPPTQVEEVEQTLHLIEDLIKTIPNVKFHIVGGVSDTWGGDVIYNDIVNSEFSESCPMAYIDPIRTAIGTIS